MPDTNIELIIDVEVAELVIAVAVKTTCEIEFGNSIANCKLHFQIQSRTRAALDAWLEAALKSPRAWAHRTLGRTVMGFAPLVYAGPMRMGCAGPLCCAPSR